MALHTVNTQAVAKNSQDQPWVVSGWNCYAKISPEENFATFLNSGIFPAKFSPGEIPPPPCISQRTISWGGGMSPPLEIPKLHLPHAHPNRQAHAPFRGRRICQSNCHSKPHSLTTSERACGPTECTAIGIATGLPTPQNTPGENFNPLPQRRNPPPRNYPHRTPPPPLLQSHVTHTHSNVRTCRSAGCRPDTQTALPKTREQQKQGQKQSPSGRLTLFDRAVNQPSTHTRTRLSDHN